MSDTLTSRQQEILQLIRDTVEQEGRPPTRAEICTAFGFRSPNAAETHLRALAAKGAITLEEGRARGIRLMEALGLPLIGRVAAGSPILAAEHIQGRYQVDPGLFSPRADYLLKVRTKDIVEYRRVLAESISALPHVAATSTYVAMEAVKEAGAA